MPKTFHQKVIEVIKKIPRGKVATYGMIATLAGSPKAARQVVRTLHTASDKERLPWHRVINSKGQISLKPGQGYEEQKGMLLQEGVIFDDTNSIDLKRFLWQPRVKGR